VGTAHATRILTVTLVLDGQMTKAWERAEEAMSLAMASQRPRQQRAAYQLKARVALALEDHELAQQNLDEALRLAVEIAEPLPRYLLELERSALDRDFERARGHIEWFEKRGLRYGIDVAHRLFPELARASTSAGTALAPEVFEFRLDVLGPMRLTTGTETVLVRGRKRQELLATLLEARIAGRTEVPRLSLIESLYPDQAEIRAGTLLADLVYQVRERFGAGIVTTTANGYALGSSLTSDAENFLAHGDTRLWRGTVLGGLDLAGRS